MGIYEIVQKLEAYRKKRNIVKIVKILSPSVIFFIYAFLETYLLKSDSTGLYVGSFLCLVTAVICLIIFDVIIKSISIEYKYLYKGNFVVKVLNEKLDDVEYDYDRGFEDRYVREFGIVTMGDEYSSEDYLKASYKGIGFEQADVTIKNREDDSDTLIFKGRMFVFDFPYKKVSPVQIFTKFFPYKGTSIGNFIMKKVEMESEQFNKTFDIKAANEIEAFYLLTPHMMENIVRIKQKYNHVALNFQDNKLFLGIWTLKDTFDGNPIRRINYLREKEDVLKEVTVITDIIDALYLMKDENANMDSEL